MKIFNCIMCNKELENDVGEDCQNQLYGATTFQSYRQFGATIFDPMDETYIEINVCDVCLNEKKDSVYHVREHKKVEHEYYPFDVFYAENDEQGKNVKKCNGKVFIQVPKGPGRNIIGMYLTIEMCEKCHDRDKVKTIIDKLKSTMSKNRIGHAVVNDMLYDLTSESISTTGSEFTYVCEKQKDGIYEGKEILPCLSYVCKYIEKYNADDLTIDAIEVKGKFRRCKK